MGCFNLSISVDMPPTLLLGLPPFPSFFISFILTFLLSYFFHFYFLSFISLLLLCKFQKYNTKSAEYCTNSQLSSVTAFNSFLQSVSNNNQTFQVQMITSYSYSYFNFLFISIVPSLQGMDINILHQYFNFVMR